VSTLEDQTKEIPFTTTTPCSLAEGLLDALLVVQHEGHEEVNDEVKAGRNEVPPDETEAHLLGLDIDLLRPSFATAKGLLFDQCPYVVDHWRGGQASISMMRDRQRR